MSLHWLLGFVLIIAVIIYFLPDLDAVVKKIFYFIAVVCTILWFLGLLGIWTAPGLH